MGTMLGGGGSKVAAMQQSWARFLPLSSPQQTLPISGWVVMQGFQKQSHDSSRGFQNPFKQIGMSLRPLAAFRKTDMMSKLLHEDTVIKQMQKYPMNY
jgi:hypothetical protein